MESRRIYVVFMRISVFQSVLLQALQDTIFLLQKHFVIQPGETVKIPTGIRAEIDEGWVLALFPRSSLGFKYRLQLNNTVGIIDSDYFYSDNEGHMFIKITNDSNEDKTLELPKGAGVVQGIFPAFRHHLR